MKCILTMALTYFLCGTCAFESSLKISLEHFNLTYVNKQFIELHATAVAVSKNTNKLRGTGLSYYELTDNLQAQIEGYRIAKSNKQYLILRLSRSVRLLMRLAETEFATDLRSHFIPDFYWPIKSNLTYTLRDWWFKHSQSPFELPTGRIKGIVTVKYPNNTILGAGNLIANIFNSVENYD